MKIYLIVDSNGNLFEIWAWKDSGNIIDVFKVDGVEEMFDELQFFEDFQL